MSNKTAQEEQDFSAAMQQLSAEAEKILPPLPIIHEPAFASPVANGDAPGESDPFTEQIRALENQLVSRFEAFAAQMESTRAAAFAEQFRRIDEQLSSIRNTESVNQQLFDSLHSELLKYRDNFLHESLQKPFIHDLVYLYDHLNGLCDQLTSVAQEKGKRSSVSQWRDNLENAIHSLVEILHRFDVKEIEPRERVDRAYHRVINYEPADFPEEDGAIVMRVKRGFVWRGKLIRPEEVIVKRFG
ncbi:MAG TPA: nucleotide exchange factor GrpE [Chthoniobacterales bacterium]|jgi:molecular chaperone GrpE (heat shock protein)|nr:nucleotide exchange factor GrpE [Chthoniobacterales bacterium]